MMKENFRKYGSKFGVIHDMDKEYKDAEAVMLFQYRLERWNKEKTSLNLAGDGKSPLRDH